MADITVNSEKFLPGHTVGIYPGSDFFNPPPPGPAIASQVVDAQSNVTFTGLTPALQYWLASISSGEWKSLKVWAPALSTGGGGGVDVETVQDTVAGMILDTPTVDATYDDALGQITLDSKIRVGTTAQRDAIVSPPLNTPFLVTDDPDPPNPRLYYWTGSAWRKQDNVRVFNVRHPQWGESATGILDGGATGIFEDSERDYMAIQHALNAAGNVANARTVYSGTPTGPADPQGTEWDPADTPSWNGAIVYVPDGIYRIGIDYNGDRGAASPKAGFLTIPSNVALVGESWATILRMEPSGLQIPAHTPVHASKSTITGSPGSSGDLTVADASGFPSSGNALVGSEKFVYTGKSGNTFTGCVRGAFGTTAAAHTAGDVVVRLAPAAHTTLNDDGGGMDTSETTITLTDASGFPSASTIKIDSETITYTGKSGNDLTGCVRGAASTTPATHTNGASVYQNIANPVLKISVTGAIPATWAGKIGSNLASIQHAKNAMASPSTRFTGLQKEPGYNILSTLIALGSGYVEIASATWSVANVAAWGAITNSTGRIGISPAYQSIRTLMGSSNVRMENFTIDGNDANRCRTGPGIRMDGSAEGTPEASVIWNERVRINNLRIVNTLEDSIIIGRAKDVVVSNVYAFTRRGSIQFWYTPTDVRCINCLTEGNSDDAFAFLAQNWPIDPPNGFGVLASNISAGAASVPVTATYAFGTTSSLGTGQIGNDRFSWTGKSGTFPNITLTGVVWESASPSAYSAGDVVTTRENRPGVRAALINCVVGPMRFNEVDGQVGGSVDISGQQGLIVSGLYSRRTGNGITLANAYGVPTKDVILGNSIFEDQGRLDQDADGYYQTDRPAYAISVESQNTVRSQTAGLAYGEDPAAGVIGVRLHDIFIRNSRGNGINFAINAPKAPAVGGFSGISRIEVNDASITWDLPLTAWVHQLNDARLARGIQFLVASPQDSDYFQDVRVINTRILNSPGNGIETGYSGFSAPATIKRFRDFKIRGSDVLDSGTVRGVLGSGNFEGVSITDPFGLKVEMCDLRDRKPGKTMRGCLGINYPDGRIVLVHNDMSEYLTQPFTKFAGFPMPSGSHLRIRDNEGWKPWRGIVSTSWNAAAARGLGAQRTSGGGGGTVVAFNPEFPTGVVPRMQLTPQGPAADGAIACDQTLALVPDNLGFRIVALLNDTPANFTANPVIAWEADDYEV